MDTFVKRQLPNKLRGQRTQRLSKPRGSQDWARLGMMFAWNSRRESAWRNHLLWKEAKAHTWRGGSEGQVPCVWWCRNKQKEFPGQAWGRSGVTGHGERKLGLCKPFRTETVKTERLLEDFCYTVPAAWSVCVIMQGHTRVQPLWETARDVQVSWLNDVGKGQCSDWILNIKLYFNIVPDWITIQDCVGAPTVKLINYPGGERLWMILGSCD